jgi:hypothetical protein
MVRRTSCVLALAAVAGCGGSDDQPTGDREQIEATVSAHYGAMAEGDGEEACRHMTPAARENMATAFGTPSCEEAIELVGEAIEADREGRRALSEMRVESAEIEGSKARVRLAAGERRAPAPVPMEETGEGWKVAGTSTNVNYRSQAEAECVSGGMSSFDAGNVDPFWKREGREDFRDYLVQSCRRADARGVLDGPGNLREFERIAGRVIRGMARSGQIRGPR